MEFSNREIIRDEYNKISKNFRQIEIEYEGEII